MYLRTFISVGMIHLGMAVWYRVAKHNTLHWYGNYKFPLFCHQNAIVNHVFECLIDELLPI